MIDQDFWKDKFIEVFYNLWVEELSEYPPDVDSGSPWGAPWGWDVEFDITGDPVESAKAHFYHYVNEIRALCSEEKEMREDC